MAEGIARNPLEMAQSQSKDQCAGGIADREADVLHKQLIEFLECLMVVFASGQGHFLEHERVAADGTLTKDHQVARENIGAFDRDEYWRTLPIAPQVVFRPHDDALATVHIHGVLDALAATLGQVVFEHSGKHRGFFAQVHGLGS
ncbi:hypothetical protein D3C77_560990 [compost metagenome]